MKTPTLLALLASLLLPAAGALAQSRPLVVEFQTNLGTIAIRPDYAKAPVTADNFIDYVESGFYKDVLIHRAVKDRLMQGGGFSRVDGTLKPTNPPIVLESTNLTGLSNLAGTIAMARAPEPNTATSQFYINVVDNTGLNYQNLLNPGYAVFGRVIKGLTVAGSISGLPATEGTQVPFTANGNILWIEAVFVNDVWDRNVSHARIRVDGSGSVTSVPAGIACGDACVLSQPAGSPLTLKALPVKNWVFTGWRGDCRGLRRVINVDTNGGNINCTASFRPQGPLEQ